MRYLTQNEFDAQGKPRKKLKARYGFLAQKMLVQSAHVLPAA